MPNWCSNRLVVTGPTSTRKNFLHDCCIAAAKSGSEFTFHMVLPMPKELEGTRSPRLNTADEIRKLAADNNWPEDVTKWHLVNALSPEDAAVLDGYKMRFGSDNWYDWCNIHWGTKWDAQNANINPYTSGITITFDTAWGPPVGVIHALAACYPKLKFRNTYRIEGYSGKDVLIGDPSEYVNHVDRFMERLAKLRNEPVSA